MTLKKKRIMARKIHAMRIKPDSGDSQLDEKIAKLIDAAKIFPELSEKKI